MAPTVSVVVPTYNNAAFVEQTMASIFDQTYDDFDVVISDHSSTDGTWEIVQQYADDPRVTLLRCPRGGGAPANWRMATDAATGRYLKLVCGDDLIYPTCLAEQVAAMQSAPDVVLVASQRDILDAAGQPMIHARGLQGLDGLMTGRAAVRAAVRAGTNLFGEPACVLLDRDALVRTGGWDDRAPYLIDLATSARVALQGSVVALRRPLAGFRVSPEQWSVQLVHAQADHASLFHHNIAAENPGLLTEKNIRLGNRKAAVMAWMRRSAYVYVRQRMRLRGVDARVRGRQVPAPLGQR